MSLWWFHFRAQYVWMCTNLPHKGICFLRTFHAPRDPVGHGQSWRLMTEDEFEIINNGKENWKITYCIEPRGLRCFCWWRSVRAASVMTMMGGPCAHGPPIIVITLVRALLCFVVDGCHSIYPISSLPMDNASVTILKNTINSSPPDKMTAISQPFRRRYFQMQFCEWKFRIVIKFHWSLSLSVQLTLTQHWFR